MAAWESNINWAEIGKLTGQRQAENKALAARTKAIETLAPYVAEQAGIPPEMVERYLQQDPGESPRSRYERLSEVMNQVITANTLKQQRQQLDTGALELGQRRRQAAERDEIARYADKQLATAGQLGRGVGTGVLRPEIQEEALAYAQSPAGQLRRQGVNLTPEMLYEYAKPGNQNWSPTLEDLGNGVTAMKTSPRSAVPISKGAAGVKPVSNAGKLLADADALARSGRSEDAEMLRGIAKKQAAGKPMSPMEFMMMKFMENEGMGGEYQAYLDGFGGKGAKGDGGGKAEAAAGDGNAAKAPGAPGALPDGANAEAWARAHPDDPRAAQILKRLGVGL
jgi:hypothetical protein